jgi:hypothetical protein
MQKADDPDPPSAARLNGQPLARGLDVCEGLAPTGLQIAADGQQTGHLPSPGEEVGCHGEIADTGQPVRLVAQVVAHTQGIVEYDDTRPRPLTRWPGEVATKLVCRGRDGHVCHVIPLLSD